MSELNIILQEAWHAIDLVKEFQSGGQEHSVTKLRYQSAKTFMQDTISYFSSRGIRLQINLDEQLDLYEVVSCSALTPIFSNLVQNIQRHSKEKSVVFFKTRIFNEFIMISFKNELRVKPPEEDVKSVQLGHGLESIERTCRKFGGKVRFEQRENYFISRLYIPIQSNCPVSLDFAA